MQFLQQEPGSGPQVEETLDRATAIQDGLAGAAQRHAGRALDRTDAFLLPILLGVIADQRSARVEHVDHRRVDVD